MADTGALKNFYGKDTLLFQQNLTAKLFNSIPKSDEPIGGNGRFQATYMSGNESGGAINPGESLSRADDDDVLQPYIIPKLNHWPVEITGSEIRRSENIKGAFARLLTSRMGSALKRMNSDLNRQGFGDATGTLTQVNGAVTASQTIIVDDVQYLRKNQYLDVYATLGGAREATKIKITGITISTNTITVDRIVTLSDNGVLVKHGVQDSIPSGSDGKELTGLGRMIDTTTSGVTYQGIDRSVYTDYQSNVIDAGNVPCSQAILERLLRRIQIVGGDDPTKIMSRHGVYSSFVNTTITQSQHMDDKIKAGHVSFTWNGYTWDIDKDCQKGTLYMLNMKTPYIGKYSIMDPDLADLDTMGQKFGHINGYDKHYAYYLAELNYGSDKPNAHGKVINLIEPTFKEL